MLYLHVNPRLSQESESKVTYTTITSISECFTFMCNVDPIMGHGSEFQVTYTTIRSISEWFTFTFM